MRKKWYDYLWIATIAYLILGFYNIMFALLGMICFILPLGLSFTKLNKIYCNKYCGRSQLFDLIGKKIGISLNINTPKFIGTKWFRYGFLTFFMIMFGQMIYTVFLVFDGTYELKQVITLLWSFNFKWENLAIKNNEIEWIVQFAYGFYSVMVTSTILGLLSMIFFKPRSWCVFCPMGTMTQGICQIKHKVAKTNKILK